MTINKNFWAKKQDNNGSFEWLPLYIHLIDTKNVVAFLYDHWLSESQRRLINKSISNDDEDMGKKLAMFVAACHDLGKATPAFQLKKGYANSSDLDSVLIEKLANDGFDGIFDSKLASANKSHHSLASQYLLEKYGVNRDIATIVGAHHGSPVEVSSQVDNQFAYPSNYYQNENKNNQTHKLWEDNQREILLWALETTGLKDIKSLPYINQVGQVILTGLLIMADWIASNTKYFPLVSVYEDKEFDTTNRAYNGLNAWIKTETWQSSYKIDYIEEFKERFMTGNDSFYPNHYQDKFIQTIINTDDPGILVFEAPMGIGKTEAALFGLEVLAQKKAASGMYFALPTQATSNGIFPRVEKWLESVANEFDDKLSIRLIHGKAYLNETFNDLAKNINQDDPTENSNVIVNEWFSGRKSSILDDFIVGTIDQFLLMALKQKHLFLRHLGFSKKVVVIDEVHAYDAYVNQYLYQALKWLGAYDVPVIILSATLPAGKREELVKQYLLGKGIAKKKQIHERNVARDSYPLITYNDGSTIKYEDKFTKSKAKEIKVIKEDEENLLNLLENLYNQGGNIGVIVNTVKKAQNLAKEVEEVLGIDSFELIHSRFIDSQRIEKENQLLKMIGKKANRPQQKIYIGTQVIEQSLDIDFDVMITELAPIDLILQRVGRLQRHDIKRPKYYKEPILYIVGTSDSFDFDKGSASVYSPYLLARSQYFLQDPIIIPDDLSTLVQKVYSEDEIHLSDDLKEKYHNFKKEHEIIIDEKENRAKVFRIANPDRDFLDDEGETIMGWLNNSNEVITEEETFAQVRDSKETIEVIALQKNEKGIGLFGTDYDIMDKIEDYNFSKKVVSNTLKLPQVLSEKYNISQTIEFLEKYNINYLFGFQNNVWLRSSMGIIFNENDIFEIGDYILKYSNKYGLSYERK
ncbi:CRISPR-associated helicase/endonuclease Cas3 [Anaerococcus urinomassiliensis]|uniref:CRISPR-associated helicase/endonuclease Cas3 n=1 Tax=Anaerococcus urinomassiliensis TaxID=1745712 RepID=UPI00093F0F71|nr:CRISPR-associated helicase/endonuclease Cas3 [Anaerococcus urinomassiliensis]